MDLVFLTGGRKAVEQSNTAERKSTDALTPGEQENETKPVSKHYLMCVRGRIKHRAV